MPHRTVLVVAGWRVGRRHRLSRRRVKILVVALGVALLAAGLSVRLVGSRSGDLVIGAVEDPTTTLPSLTADTLGPDATAAAAAVDAAAADGPGIRAPGAPGRTGAPSGQGLLDANGRPYGAPVPFNDSIPVPEGLVWVLLIGSDARPGEPTMRSRTDSVHLLAANPATGQATILGFPRDSFVDIPGHGTAKINTAMEIGGPELLARTINRFTGLPVQYWVVAGFEAFQRVVDDVGGVDIEVPFRMDDHDSGAHFQPGYHHFNGASALAFSRDRHEFADGDLSRSRNQGLVVLAALAKLRAEVGDEAGLRTWLGVAFRHLTLDLDPEQALQLLAVARRTDPSDVANVVLQGRGGMAGSQLVVFIDAQAAARIADDLRPDAVIGPARTPPTTTTTAPSTTTTSSSVTSPPGP